MEMKDKIAEARSKVDELGHVFKSKYKRNKKIIYIFAEGKDDIIFYTSFIENYLPEGWDYDFILASETAKNIGCKTKIINSYNNFNWKIFNKNQIIFLLDRDLSDFLDDCIPKSTNVYVTDGYSIENSIISSKLFCRALHDLCDFSHLSCDERDIMSQFFEKQFKIFYDEMIQIMAWILYWRQKGYRPLLNSIKIKDLFKVEKGEISLAVKDKERHIHLNAKVKKDDVDIESYFKKLKKHKNSRLLIRGKYVFQFFEMLCRSVHKDYKEMNLNFLEKTSRRDPKLEFTDIAHMVQMPVSFKMFLNNSVKKYVSQTI